MSNLNVENTKGDEKNRFLSDSLKDHLFHSRFFYPNICPLCSSSSKNSDDYIQMIRCDKCNMISYCGKLHQEQHEKQHQDLCREIQNLLKSSGSTNLFNFMKNIEDPDERLNEKYRLISTVEQGLNRKLYNDEKQMFLHPRICCLCSESDPALLINCKFCPQVNFCKDHINCAEHKKDYMCANYKYCFDLDWRFLLHGKYDTCANTKNFPFSFPNPETVQLPEDMTKLLTYVTGGKITPIMKMFGNNYWPAVWTDIYSNTLTLMHVIQNLKLVQSKLIIHIIGNENSKREYYAIHEVLLHLFPQLKYLKVVVIGEELEQKDILIERDIGICEKCHTEDKIFIVDNVKLPYASYVEKKPFEAPHLIITYNCGESKVYKWAESLLKMVDIQAPFVMTTSTKSRAEKEHNKITELFGDLTVMLEFKKNPFASERPYRDAREDGLKYENSYIAVYNLCADKVSLSDKGTEGTSERALQKLRSDQSSKESGASEEKEGSKVEATGATEAQTSKSAPNIQEEKSEISSSSSIQTQASQKLQSDQSSKESGASEDKEESKVEATGATEAQTSKSGPNIQEEKSENKGQEQKEEKQEKSKKKSKKSETHESSKHNVEKIKRKIAEITQETYQLSKLIPELAKELPKYKTCFQFIAVDLIEEILTLEVCLEDLVKKLSEAFKTNDE